MMADALQELSDMYRRKKIINEIKNVIETQGLDINKRHLDLVADAMTSSGTVKGVTRMGIITDKASILARATFETPDKQFINATMKGSKDEFIALRHYSKTDLGEKHCVVVYKENKDGFVITAFFTSKPETIIKRGVIWQK